MSISNSEVQCYKRCKRRWYLRYFRHLRPIRTEATGALPLGSRVHRCLEEYYTHLQTGEDNSVALALGAHDVLVDTDLMLHPEQADAINKDATLSRIMLEGYFDYLQETGADQNLEVIAAEEHLESPIVTELGTVTAVGKIDLRVRDTATGSDYFLDHKTVQEFTTPTKSLHMDEQLKMYHWLLRQKGQRVDGAIYNMLRKVKRGPTSKPPFYERMVIQHSPQEIDSFYTRLCGEVEDILRTTEALNNGGDHQRYAYPHPTRDCSWDCEFYPVCPLMDRPQDSPEDVMQYLYETYDPYERYEEAVT